MKVVTHEQVERSQVAISIEAERNEVEESLDKAYRRLAKKVSVPGFRKGKTPRNILEQHLGQDSLFEEALEQLIPDLYRQAIKSEKIAVIAQPKIEIVQKEPLVFKATVPVKPTVNLGNYRQVKIEPVSEEIANFKIDSEMVDEILTQIQQQQTSWSPVDHPVQLGNAVTFNIKVVVEDKILLDRKDMTYEITERAPFPLPGFAEAMAGMQKNEEKSFSISVPEDYDSKEMAGKDCLFDVFVSEIKEKNLPAIDDELAINTGHDSLDVLKQKIAADLQARAEKEKEDDLRQKVVAAVTDSAEVDYPEVMEERELDWLLKEDARRTGHSDVAGFLALIKKTEDEYKEALRPAAQQRVKQALVLEKVAEEEKIAVEDSDIENKISELLENNSDRENMEKFFAMDSVKESLKDSLLMQKTVKYLVQMAYDHNQVSIQENETCEEKKGE